MLGYNSINHNNNFINNSQYNYNHPYQYNPLYSSVYNSIYNPIPQQPLNYYSNQSIQNSSYPVNVRPQCKFK